VFYSFIRLAQNGELGYYLHIMVNRMRATRAHRDNRRSHHALDEARFSKCGHCGAQHKSHTVCMKCGYYNGRQVLNLAAKAEKKLKKAKAATKK